MVDPTSRSIKLSNLYPDTRYLICVLALGNWANRPKDKFHPHVAGSRKIKDNSSIEEWEIFNEVMLPLLVDSPTSKCTEKRTPDTNNIIQDKQAGITDHEHRDPSLLTRRLGLIIGCCMGFIVFIVLVSVLGYLKVKKQQAAVKRDQPIPPEYISYRHFSIQSGEAGGHGGHPHFITNMNTTTLN